MNRLFLAALAVVMMSGMASAQEAPTPRSSPRTPVHRQAVPERKPELPASHVLQGQLAVLDSEKLRIGDIDMRLFGIVPPQLSASYGPQARAALDSIVAEQNVTCMVHDRDQAGRYLATCRTGNGNDLALELLRRGLAVTARGSLASSDLAIAYMSAEQTAQAQKLGLWSGVVPAATLQAVAPKAAPMPEVKPEAPKAESVVIPPPAPPAPVADAAKDVKAVKSVAAPEAVEAKAPVAQMAASSLAASPDEALAVTGPSEQPNFLMRYQLLITGFIMLVTALSILTVVSRQRRQEKADELKAAAAALRGELMAARAVCQARLKTISTEAEDKAASWPRIRAMLYQAYVGRLGFLGAELARQIASIYGQSSDYAAYYNAGDEARIEVTPKKKALQALMDHIEEVLPKLAAIEQTGRLAASYGEATYVRAPVTVEKTVAASVVEEPIQTEETPAASASAPVAVKPLWESVRKFARQRFAEQTPSNEDQMPDYASLIEEEMANMTFGEAEDIPVTTENVTKLRETGS